MGRGAPWDPVERPEVPVRLRKIPFWKQAEFGYRKAEAEYQTLPQITRLLYAGKLILLRWREWPGSERPKPLK